MAEQLIFFSVLSLKDISLRRVVAVLWSNTDISASVSKFRIPKFTSEESRLNWLRVVEDEVIRRKVSKLELPESLKEQMVKVVRPIGIEVRRWKHYLQVNKIRLPDSTNLIWTTIGQIDYQKTAEELVRCDTFDVMPRFRLACLNCLEDDISLIWEKLTKESKKRFVCYFESSKLTCWPYIIRGNVAGLDYLLKSTERNLTFNQWAFEQSAVKGNKVSTKYFFQKLTYEERESSLVRTVKAVLDIGIISISNIRFRNENLSDVFCYLLTLLTPQQQLETIQARPVYTLLSFFFCPCQDLFLLNAGFLWNFIPEIIYPYLASEVLLRYRKFSRDFSKHLQELVIKSPPNFKKFLGDTEMEGYHCFLLFLCCDSLESIKAMFRNLDARNRVKFLFKPYVCRLLCKLISTNHISLVEMCLQEASLSKEEKKKMKDALKNSLEYRENGGENNSNFKRCFEFLDETETSANDRKKARKCKLENCSSE